MIIYKATNKINGKMYIGQTTQNLKNRNRNRNYGKTLFDYTFKKYGEDGFLVEAENTNECAEKIIFLIENQKDRKEMGTKAKENVKRYLPEEIVCQWQNLFKKLLR